MLTPLISALSAHVFSAGLPVFNPSMAAPARFERAKFVVESGSGESFRNNARGLTDEQRRAFIEFLRPGGRALPVREADALLSRVEEVLAGLDARFREPSTAADWDRRLSEAREAFLRRHGPPAQAVFDARQWEAALDDLLRGVASGFGDPQTRYSDRDETWEGARPVSIGLGVHTARGRQGLRLVLVIPDAPADKAGLREGDEIVSIDGVELGPLSLDAMRRQLAKPEGRPMRFVFARAGQRHSVTVARGEYSSPALFSGWAPGHEGEIGHVYFAEFGKDIDAKVFAAIEDLKAKGAKGIVLDMRGNPGGLLTMARSIVSEFLEDKQVIDQTWRRGQVAETSRADGPGRFRALRISVALDGGSASASEVTAAGLQDHARAPVVGTPSYGKGTYQTGMPVNIANPDAETCDECMPFYPDGSSLTVTEGKWTSPRGRWIQGRHDPETGRNVPRSGGVKPDILIDLSEEQEAQARRRLLQRLHNRPVEGHDAVLEAAAQALKGPLS